MRDRIARLRFWLGGSAIFLVVVIAAYIAYGRLVWHLRHIKMPLPPGVNIVREAGGWTYSRANGSKTLYTIHAAGFEQGKDGKTALHEVSVVLFGRNGDRHDRVYGQDFEYDEKQGVLRALGLVHIDLQSAEAAKVVGQEGQSSVVERPEGQEALEPNVIHVTTSRLVYLDKLGIAATSEDVDVQSGQMKGHARGADYSSDSGMLMLHSAVSIVGTSGGHEVRITAAQAQFDQRSQEARLTDGTYQSEGRSIAAEHAVLYRRENGTLSKVDADGNVTLAAPDGNAIARRAELLMNATGQPASAVLSGGVRYTSDEPLRQVRAQGAEARVSFGSKLEPEHAMFAGAVNMLERVRTTPSGDRWSTRELTAGKVETRMAPGASGRMQLRNADATGNARFVTVIPASGTKANAPARTELAADELKAVMAPGGTVAVLEELTGQGHTWLHQVSETGTEQTSTGDTLEARFHSAGASSGRNNPPSPTSSLSEMLASALQQGHVTIMRRIPAHLDPAKAQVAEQVQHAVADRAAYDGAKDQLKLSGAVRMSDAESAIWAQQVVMDHLTGDAHASGAVKVDYVAQPGTSKRSGEPMHITAEHADVNGGNSSATFYGSPVRVWQSGNQVQAPEVQVERAARRLIARGSDRAGTAAGAAVRTILVNAAEGAPGTRQAGAGQATCGFAKPVSGEGVKANGATLSVVRIASGGLVYSGLQHQVEFTGGVRADAPDATVRAAQATAFLKDDGTGNKSTLPSLEGGLSRMVATGEVDLARAGTRALGNRLVYEAATRMFLLSGSEREPAKAIDVRGTTTAAAFRFSGCDDTLEAMGEAQGAAKQRVQTDAVASSARKTEKAGR